MKELLERIARLKIMVVGDVILDHYIWGDASRISPEAPVPVVAVDHDSYTVGGAANVALNLRALGCKVSLFGVVGRDEAGERVRTILSEKGVEFNDDFGLCDSPTIVKTRVVVRNQQLCRLDREDAPRAYSLDIGPHMHEIAAEVRDSKAAILSDYAKGVITEELIAAVKADASVHDTLTAYDPKPKRKLNYSEFDLLTPNRAESLVMAGIELEAHDDYPADEVCARIWERFHPKHLVITLGGEGMLLSEEGKVSRIIPTYAREVFDVSGAGDTVIASLTAGLAANATMEDAAHFANTVAGVVVGKVGTATATPEEILQYEASHE